MLVDTYVSTLLSACGVFVMANSCDPSPAGCASEAYSNLLLSTLMLKLDFLLSDLYHTMTTLHCHAMERALEGAAVGVANSSLRVNRSVGQLMRFYSKSLGSQPDATMMVNS